GCVAGEEDVWRYSRAPLERAAVHDELAGLDGLIRRSGGLVCLAGHEQLLSAAPERRVRAARLHRRARRIARVAQYAPSARGLLLTGWAAAGEAAPGADPDLLVLIAPGRIGTVFALLAPIARITRRRAFCPNHYRSADRLAIEPRDLYVAR